MDPERVNQLEVQIIVLDKIQHALDRVQEELGPDLALVNLTLDRAWEAIRRTQGLVQEYLEVQDAG